MAIPCPPAEYRIRTVGSGDRSYLLNSAKGSVLKSVPTDEAELSNLWIDCVLAAVEMNLDGLGMKNEAFILEREDGMKAGMLWMGESKDQFTCDDTGYLLGIFVEEELRGIGLGKMLMNAAERWCRDKGFLSMTLNVGAWNRNARAIYDKYGFDERSVVMKKDLPRQ